jgi:hypothetical protein
MTGWTDEARAASLAVREAEAKDHNANGKAPGQETHHQAIKAASNLTRQHFVAAANQLRESGASAEAVSRAANAFAMTNPNFDRGRFVAAATKGLTKGLDIRSQSNKGFAKASRVAANVMKNYSSGSPYLTPSRSR